MGKSTAKNHLNHREHKEHKELQEKHPCLSVFHPWLENLFAGGTNEAVPDAVRGACISSRTSHYPPRKVGANFRPTLLAADAIASVFFLPLHFTPFGVR
jgi:hypothetical protein